MQRSRVYRIHRGKTTAYKRSFVALLGNDGIRSWTGAPLWMAILFAQICPITPLLSHSVCRSAQADTSHTSDTQVRPTARTLVGWVERVRILPEDVVLQAKLDTGAESASLHADAIEEFQKDGKSWVRFQIENRLGKTITLERPLVSFTRIKRNDREPDRRPMIRLGICLAGYYMETEVNLVNRSDFDYLMLIGRNYLAGHVTVDPAQMMTVDPDCPASPRR